MAKIDIKVGNGLIDGSYDLDLSYFTLGELHKIKKESGIVGGQLGAAIEDGDTDAVVMLAYIALLRAEKRLPNADLLWQAKAGEILIDFSGDAQETEEDISLPPVSGRGEPPVSDAEQAASGPTSSDESALPAADPSPTGVPV